MNYSNSDLTNNDITWNVTSTATDEQINQFSCAILDNPATYNFSQPLYTKEQMLEMFRLGVSSITGTDTWKRFVKTEERIVKNAYNTMRRMNIGDIVILSYDQWNSARVAASKLKNEFGCMFRVNKMGDYGVESDIRVERII